MTVRNAVCLLLFLAVGCAHVAPPAVPYADYHQHLISPAAAALNSDPALPAVAVPEELARVLRTRAERWNDKNALAELFTDDAMVLDPFGPAWMHGRAEVSSWLGGLFDAPYVITPVAFALDGDAANVTGYYTEAGKHFGHIQLSLRKGTDGKWRIAAESPLFEAPYTRVVVTGEQVVAQLDDAGMQKAVVLSVAYWFGAPRHNLADEYEKVRAENDFVAAEVGKYPRRLAGACSFNPLKEYALAELERCSKLPNMKALKLHLGNSRIDIAQNAEHVAKLQEVFRAANARRLALVVHMWTSGAYEKEGAAHAKVFLEQLLPAAPDVTVQIAHMAGGGRSTDTALEVFASAIAGGDPRTKHLYFDVATLTGGQSDEGVKKDAMRMRQIGFDRILFGSDTVPPNPPAGRSWRTFRAFMPLTDAELAAIAGNVAPYVR